MGKAGHSAVTDFWDTNPDLFSSPEDRAEYVADALDDLHFVYKTPDVIVSIKSFGPNPGYSWLPRAQEERSVQISF
jgi:hypothetical protein